MPHPEDSQSESSEGDPLPPSLAEDASPADLPVLELLDEIKADPEILQDHQRLTRLLARFEYTSYVSSPFPPARVLAELEKIVPGSAARVLEEFHLESAQRRKREDREDDVVEKLAGSDIWQGFLGLGAAFVISLIALAIAWDLGQDGHELLAGVIVTGALGSIVASFLLAVRRLRSRAPESE